MTNPILNGKYALVRKIATGGMAEIFLAKQLGLAGFEKIVVIKRILPHLAGNKAYVRMFLDEARTSADLHHSSIVHTFEIDEENGIYFMVMEFLYGQDLRTIFRRLHRRVEIMPHEHVVGIIVNAASALHYVHTKRDLHGKKLSIVHRDVSPHNLIITYEGETKLVDFGIAKHMEREFETNSGVLKGKYAYMSPEQVENAPLTAKSDQFSLAIVAYELFTGTRLFKKDCQLQTLKDVAECQINWKGAAASRIEEPIKKILAQALLKEKSHRFESCLEFRMALEDAARTSNLIPSTPKFGIYLKNLFSDLIQKDEQSTPETDLAGVHTVFWSLGRTALEDDALTKATEKQKTAFKSKMMGLAFTLLLISCIGYVAWDQVIKATFIKKTESILVDYNEKLPEALGTILSEWENETHTSISTSDAIKVQGDRPPGRLKIVVNPWAEVILDGKKLGTTPLMPVNLPPGKYQLQLNNHALKKDIYHVVTVAPGKDTVVRENWIF